MLPTLKFHHIGIATPDIDSTAEMYVKAGYKRTETVIDPLQNIYICFLSKDEMPLIELLAPVNETSPVVKILEKSGVSPYHCCYVSTNLDADLAALKKLKYVMVSKPKNACAIDGKRVAFLFHKHVGLIELVEE